MKPIPLHRVATALPFTDYLHRLGTPVARELRRAKLPVLAMDDPDCFIPTRNYWNFVAEVAKREGIDDLGFLVGQHAGADAADPDLSAQLEGLPTLHHALNLVCTLASTEISQVALWHEWAIYFRWYCTRILLKTGPCTEVQTLFSRFVENAIPPI